LNQTAGGSTLPFGEPLLLQELTHRINNELAATIGFVRLTAAQSASDDVKVALAGVIQHVSDTARIYRALQMPVTDDWIDAAAYLRELCRSISRAKLQHNCIELALIEAPLQLNAARCWRLGMIVSELITNASRHAFCGGGGKIRVELVNRDAWAQCTVSDDGSGSRNSKPGQGLKIIRSLVHDLHGTIDHRFAATGTTATLRFPLHDIGFGDAETRCLNLTNAKPR
jgi:two-component sensor histidine kinase